MDKPTGSGGEDGDPPLSKPETPSKKSSPDKEIIKEPEKPTEIVKKKESPVKSESETSPTKIKREDSGDGGEAASTSSGGRVKSDSSSSSHAEDVQRALSEYMTMAQVKLKVSINIFYFLNFNNILFHFKFDMCNA